jgi:hypothetical protein
MQAVATTAIAQGQGRIPTSRPRGSINAKHIATAKRRSNQT